MNVRVRTAVSWCKVLCDTIYTQDSFGFPWETEKHQWSHTDCYWVKTKLEFTQRMGLIHSKGISLKLHSDAVWMWWLTACQSWIIFFLKREKLNDGYNSFCWGVSNHRRFGADAVELFCLISGWKTELRIFLGGLIEIRIGSHNLSTDEHAFFTNSSTLR